MTKQIRLHTDRKKRKVEVPFLFRRNYTAFYPNCTGFGSIILVLKENDRLLERETGTSLVFGVFRRFQLTLKILLRS
jgi:hypothetical protein